MSKYYQKPTDVVDGSTARAESINVTRETVDVSFELVEQDMNRTLKLSTGVTAGSVEIPNVTLADGVLYFDSSNNLGIYNLAAFHAKVTESNNSAAAAKVSEDAAEVSKNAAKTSEDAAEVSKNAAKTSEDAAAISATNSESARSAAATILSQVETKEINFNARETAATNALNDVIARQGDVTNKANEVDQKHAEVMASNIGQVTAEVQTLVDQASGVVGTVTQAKDDAVRAASEAQSNAALAQQAYNLAILGL